MKPTCNPRLRYSWLYGVLLTGAASLSSQPAGPWNIGNYAAPSVGAWQRGLNGHWYALTSGPMTQAPAEQLAVGMGGHLADIADAVEWADINRMFGGPGAPWFWIGLRDAVTVCGSQTWTWTSGLPATSFFWDVGEPTCGGGSIPEFQVVMRGTGFWNDINENCLQYHGLIEIDDQAWFVNPVTGNMVHLTPQPHSYASALSLASFYGGSLLAIQSPTELTEVLRLFAGPGFSLGLRIGVHDPAPTGCVRNWAYTNPVLGGAVVFIPPGSTFSPCPADSLEIKQGTAVYIDVPKTTPRHALLEVPGSYTTFGTGCPAVNGPLLDSVVPGQPLPSRPVLGGTLTLRVYNATPNTFGFLLFGASNIQQPPVNLPYSMGTLGLPGCALFVSTDVPIPITTNGGGTTVVSIPIPNNRFLLKAKFYNQVFLGPLQTATNAGEAIIGGW